MAEEQRSGDEGPDSPEDETVVTPPADDGGKTEIIRPADGTDATRMMPPAESTPAWSGRAGVPAPEPMPRLRDSTAPGYQTGTPPPSGRTWWTPLLLGLLALGLVGIVALAAWFMTRDTGGSDKPSSPTPVPPTSAPPSPSAAPSPSISPTVSPEQLVQVPVGLIGLDQDAAAAQLQALGLFWNFSYQPSSQPQNTVIGTKPGQGELIPAGSTVTLVVAIPQSQSPAASASPSASKKN
jgi:hypothetical protein